MSVLYCRPSDIVTPGATVTVSAGTAEAAYPVANVADRLAHTVVKSTGTTITLQAVFGGSKTIQAVALINTNATAAVLTNNAGLNVSIPIPTVPADTLGIDPWLDLRAVPLTGSTTWHLALTGPTGVALGEWLLVETIRTMPLLWAGLEEDEEHRTIVHLSDYGVRNKLPLGVRQRAVRGGTLLETFRADLLALQRDAQGQARNFLLVLSDSKNDALYVDLTTDGRTVSRIHPKASGIPVAFTEQQKGWI